MNAVLLAAGLGSRLGSLTRELPKALIPVGGKPLLAHALTFAARLAPSRIVVVGGFCFPLVKETLDSIRASDAASAPCTAPRRPFVANATQPSAAAQLARQVASPLPTIDRKRS